MSKQSIWSKLKAKGFSDTACAAIMGNMQQESALRSNNVEDRSGILDNVYTDSVDSGRYSVESFISDSYGYGLCQWTAKDRKRALIQLAKQRGVSIADEGMQIDLLVQELQQPMYKMTWDSLNSGESLREMTGTFMRNFERPYDQSEGAVSYRTSLAQAIYDELAGTEPTPEPQPQPEPDTPDSLYLPGSRQICKGMMGTDVLVLQALLKAYGYDCGTPSGVFDTRTNNMLIAYQSEHGLAADGIAGPKTWGSMGVRA